MLNLNRCNSSDAYACVLNYLKRIFERFSRSEVPFQAYRYCLIFKVLCCSRFRLKLIYFSTARSRCQELFSRPRRFFKPRRSGQLVYNITSIPLCQLLFSPFFKFFLLPPSLRAFWRKVRPFCRAGLPFSAAALIIKSFII